MPDTKESARKWSGYVCPDCRFVFRVPRDHDGSGLVCPSCRRLLKIPQAGDVPPPLLAPVRSVPAVAPPPEERDETAEEPATVEPGHRRSSRNRRKHETHSWEAAPRRRNRSLTLERRHMAIGLVAGAGALLLILAAVWASFRRDHAAVTERAALPPPPAPAAEVSEVLGDSEFLLMAEPLAKTFLAAKHVDEILPLVRNPETAETRIREWYPEGDIDPAGLNRFNVTGEVKHKGGIYQVVVETRSFEYRMLSFVRGSGGLLVDWESWAGWSELPWNEFLAAKPVEPKRFRVVLRKADYYNFGFSDEEKWRSYQLDSPDRDVTVYGYVERGGLLDERLRASADEKESLFVLDLRFPADGHSRNQVIIERIVTDGWAVETEDSP